MKKRWFWGHSVKEGKAEGWGGLEGRRGGEGRGKGGREEGGIQGRVR